MPFCLYTLDLYVILCVFLFLFFIFPFAVQRVVRNNTQLNVPVHRTAVLQGSCEEHRSLIHCLEGHGPQVEVGDVKVEF